ncbi:MAG: hypothetical protein WBL93_14875, partial [Lutisporaceae bacterium]
SISIQLFVIIGIVIFTYTTVIHKLLISRQLSDKLYKNLCLAALGVGVYVSSTASFIMGLDCNTMMSMLKTSNLSLEEANKMFYTFINYQNQQTAYMLAAITFYALTLLLIKSIFRDIQIDFNKPKYRWNKSEQKSTN